VKGLNPWTQSSRSAGPEEKNGKLSWKKENKTIFKSVSGGFTHFLVIAMLK
jgi:hypothetical protein